jgi:hypothetical protein
MHAECPLVAPSMVATISVPPGLSGPVSMTCRPIWDDRHVAANSYGPAFRAQGTATINHATVIIFLDSMASLLPPPSCSPT